MKISHSFLLGMKNILDKYCTENQNLYCVTELFFLNSWRLWNNEEKYITAGKATYDNTKRRMRFICLITEVTDTQSEFVTFIASTLQEWLLKRCSMLRYTYLFSLVKN